MGEKPSKSLQIIPRLFRFGSRFPLVVAWRRRIVHSLRMTSLTTLSYRTCTITKRIVAYHTSSTPLSTFVIHLYKVDVTSFIHCVEKYCMYKLNVYYLVSRSGVHNE